MSNTIPPGAKTFPPGTKEFHINLLQQHIAALRRGESPEKVLHKDELEEFHDLGKDKYIEKLLGVIEYEKVADHW